MIFCPQDTIIFLWCVLHFSAIKLRHKAVAWMSLCTHGVLHAAGGSVCEELQINWYGQPTVPPPLYTAYMFYDSHTHTHTHTFALNHLAFLFLYPFCVLTATSSWPGADNLHQFIKIIISLDTWSSSICRLRMCWVANWVPRSLYIRIPYYTCQSLHTSMS